MTGFSKDLISNSQSSSTPYTDRQRVEEAPEPDAFKEWMEKPNDDDEEEASVQEQSLLTAFMPLPPPQLQDKQLSALLCTSSVGNTVMLSADTALLFEKMAASMLVLCSSGDKETTLFLDNRDSLFCGTRITIKEFSTAPKIFNIHIASTPSSLHLINAHKAALLSSFEQGKFPFSVHRLETEQQQFSEFDQNSEHEQEE